VTISIKLFLICSVRYAFELLNIASYKGCLYPCVYKSICDFKLVMKSKKKISLKNKGKIPWNKGIVKPKTILKGPGKGKFKRSEEFKAKLSAMKRGKLRGPYKKLAKQNKEITISPI